jgi:K+-sensing histidine kinase KdpD
MQVRQDLGDQVQAPARVPGSEPAAGPRARLSRNAVAALAGLAGPLVLSAVLVPFRSGFANTDAALALLLVVVAVAAAGYRQAGYLAALSSAAWYDFFLTRPYERFDITRAADIETTILLLVLGIAVTEIAVWGHRQHATASRRSGYLDGINDAARAVAEGDSPAALAEEVAARLVQLLSLRSCQFQYGVAGLGQPGRLEHDGEITVGGTPWNVQQFGLPAAAGTELLVESGGRLQGRYLMQPDPAARPTGEQLLVAVAFADQVGAALGASHG